MKVQIFTDGASRGNPGPAGIGIVIKKNGRIVSEIADYIGHSTNNIAEYTACLRGITEALILGASDIELYADSELLIKQIRGEYKVKNEGLQPLHSQILGLAGKLKHFKAVHIAREKNKEADLLSNIGIDAHDKKDSPLFSK